MGMGDLAASMSMDVNPWTASFKEANSVLDGFADRFNSTISTVAQGGQQIAAVSTAAAISIGSIGVGLVAIGSKGGALFTVAKTLLGISGIVNNLSTAFKNLRSGTSYFQKIVGAIGAVGAAAGIAALAIKGISAAMTKAGKDTTAIDAIGAKMSKVATAASLAILGIKGITLAVRTMQATAAAGVGAVTLSFKVLTKTIAAVPATIGAVAGSLGRLGSAGAGALRSGASAVGSFAANAGDALGQIGQSVASVATGFAFGGIVGGLATLTGVLVASGLSMKSLGLESSGITAPLTKLQESLTKIGSGIGKSALEGLGAVAKRAQPYIDSFANAVSVLAERFTAEWLPAISNAATQGMAIFGEFFTYMETEWGAWISDSVSALAEFVGNIDVYFQIAQQNIVLFASNSILQIGDFFANIGKWLDWFGENWSDVLFTAGDLAATVFINIGENIRSIFSEIWDWVSSGFTNDINIDWHGLTDGFVSTIKEWPDLLETELAQTSPELEGLYKQLGERQKAEAARTVNVDENGTPLKMWSASTGDTSKSSAASRDNKAALQGSSEAAAAFTRGLGGSGKVMEKIAQQSLATEQQILAAIKDGKSQSIKLGIV